MISSEYTLNLIYCETIAAYKAKQLLHGNVSHLYKQVAEREHSRQYRADVGYYK